MGVRIFWNQQNGCAIILDGGGTVAKTVVCIIPVVVDHAILWIQGKRHALILNGCLIITQSVQCITAIVIGIRKLVI